MTEVYTEKEGPPDSYRHLHPPYQAPAMTLVFASIRMTDYRDSPLVDTTNK